MEGLEELAEQEEAQVVQDVPEEALEKVAAEVEHDLSVDRMVRTRTRCRRVRLERRQGRSKARRSAARRMPSWSNRPWRTGPRERRRWLPMREAAVYPKEFLYARGARITVPPHRPNELVSSTDF